MEILQGRMALLAMWATKINVGVRVARLGVLPEGAQLTILRVRQPTFFRRQTRYRRKDDANGCKGRSSTPITS